MKYVNVVWFAFIVWEIRNDFIGWLLAREGQASYYPSFSATQAKYRERLEPISEQTFSREQTSASPRLDLLKPPAVLLCYFKDSGWKLSILDICVAKTRSICGIKVLSMTFWFNLGWYSFWRFIAGWFWVVVGQVDTWFFQPQRADGNQESGFSL